MKKSILILICIFINFGICFSADFKQLSLSSAIKQSGLTYEVESISEDSNFIEEYKSNNKVFKEFFQKLPENILAYSAIGNGSFFKYSGPKYKTGKYVVAVETQNLIIYLYDAQIDDKGIHGFAQLLVNIDEKSFKNEKSKLPYLLLTFTDFYIHNDGSLESGLSDDKGVNSYYASDDYMISLDKVSLKKENEKYLIVVEEPKHNKFSMCKSVKLGRTIFSTDAKLISTEPYTQEQVIETDEKHCSIKCNYSNWDGKKFSIDFTSVYLPAFNTIFDKEKFNISLKGDDLLIKPRNKKDKINMFDFPFTMDYLTIEKSSLNLVTIKNAVIYFGQQSLQLGNLDMKLETVSDWDEIREIASMEPVIINNRKDKIKILDENDIVYEYEFDAENGLMLSFETSFPNQQSERSNYQVNIDKDGVVWTGNRCSKYFEKTYTFDKTVLEGTFDGINRDSAMYVNNATLKFPENSILNGNYLSQYYTIQKDGSLYSDIRYITFFDLGNLFINSQYFTKDGLILSGYVNWTEIVELEGLLPHLEIEKMYIGFDGLIKEFKIKEPQGQFGAFFADGWYLTNDKYSIQMNQTKDKDGNLSPMEIILSFDDCKIFPPKASIIDAIPVQNLKYRLKGSSLGFLYDDVVLPKGKNIEFAHLFEKKLYNPKDTIRLSAKEVAEISSMLDLECEEVQKNNLFRLYEEYEYDDKGAITKCINGSVENKNNQKKINSENEKNEYYDGLLCSTLYKNGYDGNIKFYSYDDNNRLIKTTTKYLQIDKWGNFKEIGTGSPEYFKYNEFGDLAIEKNYFVIKTYSYEYYSNGKVKSKKIYIYNIPNSDM